MTQGPIIIGVNGVSGYFDPELGFKLEESSEDSAYTQASAIGAVSAPAAVTTTEVVQTAPATGSYGFTQAQATALLTQQNNALTDITALQAEVAALTTALNTALLALANAGVIA